MNYAGNFVPEERSQETPFEVLPGGGLDARARRGVSPEFVANVRNVLVVAAVLILLGLVRVGLSSAAVAALNANETLSDQVTDAKNLNDDLKIERAVLSSNSRISRIATQNYSMVLSNDAMDVKVGDAAAQEQAAQGTFAAPGLPHQRQGLPFVDLQVYLGNAVEKGPLFPLHGKVFGEAPCLG